MITCRDMETRRVLWNQNHHLYWWNNELKTKPLSNNPEYLILKRGFWMLLFSRTQITSMWLNWIFFLNMKKGKQIYSYSYGNILFFLLCIKWKGLLGFYSSQVKGALHILMVKNESLGTSLVVQWLRLHASNAGCPGPVPGRGTKIPHTATKSATREAASRMKTQSSQKKKKKERMNPFKLLGIWVSYHPNAHIPLMIKSYGIWV